MIKKTIMIKTTEEEIKKFCELTGDGNTIHSDKNNIMGGIILPGAYISSIFSALIWKCLWNTVVIKKIDLEFHRPIFANTVTLYTIYRINDVCFLCAENNEQKIAVTGKAFITKGKGKRNEL